MHQQTLQDYAQNAQQQQTASQQLGQLSNQALQNQYPSQQGVCPHCGYCLHCGRPSPYHQSPYWGQPYMGTAIGGLQQQAQGGFGDQFGGGFGQGQ